MDFYGITKEYYMLINVSSSMLCLGRFLPVAIGFAKSDSLNITPFSNIDDEINICMWKMYEFYVL